MRSNIRGMLPGDASQLEATIRNRRLYFCILNLLLLLVALKSWLLGDRIPYISVSMTPSSIMLVLLVVCCSVTDLRWHRIPNWATYSVGSWAFLISCVNSIPTSESPNQPTAVAESQLSSLKDCEDWLQLDSGGSTKSDVAGFNRPGSHSGARLGIVNCVAGAGLCCCAMVIPWRFGGCGGGDVKLATAIGALTGPDGGLLVLAAAHIAAATVSLIFLVWSIGPIQSLSMGIRSMAAAFLPARYMAPVVDDRHRFVARLAMAPFFAIGSALLLVESWLP